jgi:hypothetical protein
MRSRRRLDNPGSWAGTAGRDSRRGGGERKISRWKSTNLQHGWVDDGDVDVDVVEK